MLPVRPLFIGSLTFALVAGCAGEDSSTPRGGNLNVAPLSAVEQAHVYEAAARAAFEVDDESLSLLFDPRELPRDIGLAAGPRLSDSIGGELRRRGVTKGACESRSAASPLAAVLFPAPLSPRTTTLSRRSIAAS